MFLKAKFNSSTYINSMTSSISTWTYSWRFTILSGEIRFTIANHYKL